MKAFRVFLFHPMTSLALGAFLALSALSDMVREFRDTGFHLGTHHGVALYGFVLFAKSLSDLIEGARRTSEVLATRDGLPEAGKASQGSEPA